MQTSFWVLRLGWGNTRSAISLTSFLLGLLWLFLLSKEAKPAISTFIYRQRWKMIFTSENHFQNGNSRARTYDLVINSHSLLPTELYSQGKRYSNQFLRVVAWVVNYPRADYQQFHILYKYYIIIFLKNQIILQLQNI